MDLLIRNIRPSLVKEIDEKAKKNNESRQSYMKNLIENHVMITALNERELELKNTLDKNTEIISIVGEQLKRNNELLNMIYEEDEEL